MYHYKPIDGYFGDPIPFFWDGIYHIFYLKAPLEPKRHGANFTPYAHISTRDFIHWKEHPIAIRPSDDGPDAISCWTGCIVEKDGAFYLFYTGHNTNDPNIPQSICLATSKDLDHWEKYPHNPISTPDPKIFNIHHWRDPFVFWSEKENCYLMSITTIRKDGGFWKGGALAIARSKDLLNWKPGEIFYNPGNHGYPECSDIFKIGNYWYLVCSIFDKTCYRIGETPLGPWRVGKTDSFDGVMNYAAKTISDGKNRYILGWIRTKENRKDEGKWEWAGHLSFPRQLVQDEDGTLYAKLPDQFNQLKGKQYFDFENDKDFKPIFGNWSNNQNGLKTDSELIYGEVVFPENYEQFDATFEFKTMNETKCVGIIFQANPEDDFPGYEIAIDLKHQMLIFRKHTKRFEYYTFQNISTHQKEPLHLRVIVEKGIIEAFLNNKFSISSSFYTFSKNSNISFFVEEGSVILKKVKIYELENSENLKPSVTQNPPVQRTKSLSNT